eukprot:Hpha_TRINITY_DN30255_c0_g1::TRINITY_DN30255_c0_g1_i1::g.27124::m.27124
MTAEGLRGGGGILLLDHVNLVMQSMEERQWFARHAGGVASPSPRHHVNIGPLTQFHLEIAKPGEASPQRWRGSIEVAYVPAASAPAAVAGEHVSPGGTNLSVRLATDAEVAGLGPRAGQRKNASDGITTGGLGIAVVRLPCNPGTAEPIAAFYRRVFNATVDITSHGTPPRPAAVVRTRAAQTLRFEEVAQGEVAPADVGDHVCIYVDDFEGTWRRAHAEGVAWVNPRFPHLDGTEPSWACAAQFQQFRVRSIRDGSGREVFQQEHEVRSRSHRSCPLAGGARL